MQDILKLPRKNPALCFWAALILLTLLPCRAYSGKPSTTPILRIETGMHTAAINRIGTDDENRYLVTGSFDKTVRVWELSSGSLIKTLRPPIGEGDEGKIYAVAISSDGGTVVAGGWTGYEWDDHDSIYIFDRASGRLKKRIKELPSVIFHLVYSRDGRFLVAALGRDNGIRIYSTSDYSLIAEDKDYGTDTYGVDFDDKGRLVTASYDGFIRLYDSDFKLIEKKRPSGGSHPYTARFSPDGSKIAIGFNDSTVLNVLSGKDLSVLYEPDTTGLDNGDLSKVSWSSDGHFLYAGGRYAVGDTNHIFKWDDEGRGIRKSLPASDDTIMHIIPLKDGGIAFCSGDPAFGRFDAEDKRALYREPLIADFKANYNNLLVSIDGGVIRFNYGRRGASPARLTVQTGTLELDPAEDEGLMPPVTVMENIEVTDWEYTNAPKLNDTRLGLKQYEMSRSFALSHSGSTILLGTEWYLRLFDYEGYTLWTIPVQGVVWAVNISPLGKIAVAASADGTIRWYRAADGEELLAFFPHKDKKRWVLWTPSGHYHASEGAMEIIGWHKNNGKDEEADFFPASKYKEYNRPTVVSRVLTTMGEEEAVQLTDMEEKSRKNKSGWRIKKGTAKPRW
ncbi:MAG: hypothetical protein Q8J64_01460 [Thermodesulfovibrionales bacterium]|nr:hypothetical protein [Thermodesulfovibrionales bacterium]